MSEAKKNLLNYYDAIFYINMDSSEDRRKSIEEELQDADIPVHRISASTPDNSPELVGIIENNYFSNCPAPWRINETNNKIRLIEACCAKSHSIAIQTAKDMGYKNVLVLEDDAVINEINTLNKFSRLRNNIPKTAFITYLGYIVFDTNPGTFLHSKGYYLDFEADGRELAIVKSGMMATSSYAINFEAVSEDFLDTVILELRSGSIADLFLSSYVQPNSICYATAAKPITPADVVSTINDSEEYNAVFEYSKVDIFENKLVHGFYYDNMNMFPKRDTTSSACFYLICKLADNTWRNEEFANIDDTYAESLAKKYVELLGDAVHMLYLVKYEAGSNIGKKIKILN